MLFTQQVEAFLRTSFITKTFQGRASTKTSDAILNFLHLKRSPRGIDTPFLGEKTYEQYYMSDEKRAVARFIDRFASKETKEKLLRYDLWWDKRRLN